MKGLIFTDNGFLNELPREFDGILIGGLNNLLEIDTQAREYYQGLPKEVRDMLFTRQNEINSFEALKKAANENK